MESIKQQEKKILRINSATLEEIKQIVDENQDLYASVSHFIRCACRKLIIAHKNNNEVEK